MRFSVGEYTSPRLSFAEDLEIYRAAGAEGIGIDATLKLRDPTEDLARFRDAGLTATFCMPRVQSVFPSKYDAGPTNVAERAQAMCEAARELAPFKPLRLVYGTGPFADVESDRRTAIDVLRRVIRVAKDLDQAVAFEPLHRSIGPEWSYLTDLPGTLQLIEDIGDLDIAILVDVWHLWDTPHIKGLLAENVDVVCGVHVDDWRSPTRSWADRVLPGDGVADVAGLIGALRAAGFDGWLELEIFSDDGFIEQRFPDSLWAQDPLELIRRGREKTLAVWDAQREAV